MGALIFAQHPALRSISTVSIIGVLTAVCVSFIIQRALFRKLILSKAEKGNAPFYLKKLGDVKGRRSNSESEKLYRKRAILDNYRYRSIYADVKKEFRLQRENNLRISKYIESNDKVVVINSGYGILPLFLSYKFKGIQIAALEENKQLFDISNKTARSKADNLQFYQSMQDLPASDTFILSGNFQKEAELKKYSKQEQEK